MVVAEVRHVKKVQGMKTKQAIFSLLLAVSGVTEPWEI